MDDPGPSASSLSSSLSSSSSSVTRLGDKKLILRATDHLTKLQKDLFLQWQFGANCDLILTCGSSKQKRVPVHSCVVSCFSYEISRHLSEFNCISFEDDENGPRHYYVETEEGVAFSFPARGLKYVSINSMGEDVLRALVEYMYTGTFSVRYAQALDILQAARLLDMPFITKVMEIFVTRNPDVFQFQSQSDPASWGLGPDCAQNQIQILSQSQGQSHQSQSDASKNSAQAAGIAGRASSQSQSEKKRVRGGKKKRRPGSKSGSGSGRGRKRRCGAPSTSTSTSLSQPDTPLKQARGRPRGGRGRGGGSGGELNNDVSAVTIKSEVVDPDLQELLNFSQEVEGQTASNSNQTTSAFNATGTQQQDNVVSTTGHVKKETAVVGDGGGVKNCVLIKQEVLDPGVEVVMDNAAAHRDSTCGAQSDADNANGETNQHQFYVDLAAAENTDELNNDDDENADETLEDFHERLLRPASSAVSTGSKKKKQKKEKYWRPKSLQCRLCGKANDSKEALYSHLREEHAQESFLCQQCPCVFLRKEGLTNHVRNVHDLRTWTCHHCSQVFPIANKFVAHCVGEHGDLRPFRCSETATCRFRSKKYSSLDHHIKTVHVTERNVACSNCHKCFPTQCYLRLHQRSCLKQQQHLCPECGEVFNLRSYLTSHINNKHGGERRYPCPQCDRRFSCYANRSRHMRIHNNAFPYVCEACGKKFRHSNTLKDHVKRKHEEDES